MVRYSTIVRRTASLTRILVASKYAYGKGPLRSVFGSYLGHFQCASKLMGESE